MAKQACSQRGGAKAHVPRTSQESTAQLLEAGSDDSGAAKAQITARVPPPNPPWSMPDVRVDALRRSVEGALEHFKKWPVWIVLERLLEDQGWSGSVREDMIEVVELND